MIPDKEQRNEALAPSFKRYHAAKDKLNGETAQLMRDWLAAKLTLDASWWPEKLVSGESASTDLFALCEAQSTDFLLGWKSSVQIYKAVFDFDMAEAVTRVKAKTLVLEFLTKEEAHFGPQAGRLARLMLSATAADIDVTYLRAMEDQADKIAAAVLKFLRKGFATLASIVLQPGFTTETLVEGSQFHTINGLAFGPDGRLYLASVIGESIFAFDLASGEVETVVGAEAGHADDLLFLPNGDMVWNATLEGSVRIRETGGRIRNLATSLPGVNSIALTRDGKRLFVGQVFLGEGLWEIDLVGNAPPRLVTKKTGGGLNAFHFGPDGMIYAPTWEEGQVVRMDPETGDSNVLVDGLQKPGAVRFDAQDRLYVLDDATGELFALDREGDAWSKRLIIGLASSTDNMMPGPDGLIYVSNMVDNTVMPWTLTPASPTKWSRVAWGFHVRSRCGVIQDKTACMSPMDAPTGSSIQRQVLPAM